MKKLATATKRNKNTETENLEMSIQISQEYLYPNQLKQKYQHKLRDDSISQKL